MIDKKLTDEQIVQALDGCIKPNESYSCAECQYYNKTANCVKNLMKDTLDLINRLKADVERLEKGELSKAMTFNSKTINNAVNETLKEFAERLCKDRVSNDPVVIAVKVELEEMVNSE